MARESYPVWRAPIIVGLIVICCFGWWWWKCPCRTTTTCDCRNYQEVVIDEECVAYPWDLDVTRGDVITWTNLMADTLTIKFDTSSPFLVDHFWIPPGHQLILEVRSDASVADYTYDREYTTEDGTPATCEGGAGGPTVKVGGGGP